MSRSNVRDDIKQAVRTEIIAELLGADSPVTASELHRSCQTSAEVDDVQGALRGLMSEGQVVSVLHRNKRAYRLAEDHEHPRASGLASSPSRDVVATLEATGDWLTRDQICNALRQYSRQQIGNALSSVAVRSIARPGAGVRLYGLAAWPAPDEDASPSTAAAYEEGEDQPLFAIWSDGRLSLDTPLGVKGEMSRREVSALIAYLAEVTPGTLRRALEAQER